MSNISSESTNGIEESNLVEQFKGWVEKTDIRILQGIPFIAAMFFMFGWPVILYLVLSKEAFQNYDGFYALPISVFFLGISSFMGVLKKQFYWSPFRTLKGKWAVIVSSGTTILLIAIGILLIIFKQLES